MTRPRDIGTPLLLRVPWLLIAVLFALAAFIELARQVLNIVPDALDTPLEVIYTIALSFWFLLLVARARLPRPAWYALGGLIVALLALHAAVLLGIPAQIGATLGGEAGTTAQRFFTRGTGWLIGVTVAAALTAVVYLLDRSNRVVQQQSRALADSRDALAHLLDQRTDALAESQKQFRNLADAMPDLVVRFDRAHRHVFVSRTIEEVTGRPREDFLGKTNAELGMPADLVHQWQEAIERVFQTGEPGEVFFEFTGPAGIIHFHARLTPECAPDGTIEHIVWVARDITDLRDAERQSRLLARVAQETGDAVVITNEAGEVEWVNAAFTRITGFTLDEVAGKRLSRVLHGPKTDPDTARALGEAVQARRPFHGELIGYTKDGRPFWMEISSQFLPAADGEPGRFISVERDITGRKQSEQALAESEDRYRLLAESSPDAIFVIDTDGNYHFANQITAEYTGVPLDHILAHPEHAISPLEIAERRLAGVRRAAASDTPIMVDDPVPGPDGTRWLQTRLVRLPGHYDGPVRVLGIGRDITALREAERRREAIEERVRQAQKLESLAVLAGGVAHDFNNLLMAVMGNASMLRDELNPTTTAHAMASDILSSAERAAELSRQMLAFSGHGRMVSNRLDLSAAVHAMQELIEAAADHRGEIDYELAPDLPEVDADAGQISQAVLALVTNSAEATADQKAPRLCVRTGVQDCDAAFLDASFTGQELQPGRYAYIEVADNGPGIPPEHLPRIFEPFFTTKFTGRGLGLAAVQGIMRGHHGTVAIRSELGGGAAVRLLFPEATTPAATRAERVPVNYHGEGVVLVADDEPSARRAASRMLTRMGFDVLMASDGLQALHLCEEQDGDLACILLDVTMPGLNTEETLRRLREHENTLPVIMMSGYAPQETRARFAAYGIAGVLQKPFSAPELATCLQDALTNGTNPG